jgi:transcription initiation factor TFIIIB Brf1 subunit/transcription initiation factor TFIIB
MFQLLAMTCLYLSIKLNEYKHLLIPGSKSSMDTILQLSRGFFTLKEMEKMEYNILQRLQWHVHPPTPQCFVKHFLFALSMEDVETHDLAQFMAELSVMDYFFVSYKPSEVAIAALLNATERLSPGSTQYKLFTAQTSMFDNDSSNVRACRDRLALIYAQANDQAPIDTSETTPRKVATEEVNRTTSPVSVTSFYQH